MIDRLEALALIEAVPPIESTEKIELTNANGRVLAEPLIAKTTQPSFDASAMDGYAVRFSDLTSADRLKCIGEAAAGHPFEEAIGASECVRVFTGSVIPDGADHVVIQEDVSRTGEFIVVNEQQDRKRNIRLAGVDFSIGDELIKSGFRLGPRQLSVCAASNTPRLCVYKRPRIALIANGDELVQPGSDMKTGQIIASNSFALRALCELWGADVIDLGILPDDPVSIETAITKSNGIDVFVPVGGASVGDHDYMKHVFGKLGFKKIFSKVAIKPGKPTWFFQGSDNYVLGLPGNPASALVCAHLFLKPLLYRLTRQSLANLHLCAELTAPCPSNGRRETFMRAIIGTNEAGRPVVTPASNQDSSLLSPFVLANALIQRAVNAPEMVKGDIVTCWKLD